MPGRIATIWAQPIHHACHHEGSTISSLLSGSALSERSSAPVTISVKTISAGAANARSIVDSSASPATPAGIVPTTIFPA